MNTKKIKCFFPVLFTLCVFLLYFFKRIIVAKYYPPVADLFIFFVFFISIFQKETIIQKFAKKINENLCEAELEYTRNLTYVWCVFLFINFVIALITVFLSDRIWFLYNACISYILIGMIFAIEYIVRIIFRKRNNIC